MYIVYSKPRCTFCDQAKALLHSKNLPYREVMFDVGQEKLEGVEYVKIVDFKHKYPNAKQAPQIFVETDSGLEHVGSFPELKARLKD